MRLFSQYMRLRLQHKDCNPKLEYNQTPCYIHAVPVCLVVKFWVGIMTTKPSRAKTPEFSCITTK